MDVAVAGCTGLPPNAYVSIRIGETRRQAPWKKLETFHFPGPAARSVHVDVFDKVGSAQVSLGGATVFGPPHRQRVTIPRAGGGPAMEVALNISLPEAADRVQKAKPEGQDAARQAMTYMQTSGAQQTLSQLVQQLMLKQPEDPLAFIAHFVGRQMEQAKAARADDALSCGHARDDPRLRCPVCLAAHKLGEASPPVPHTAAAPSLPDLSGHFSLLVEALQKDPGLYPQVCNKVSRFGVGFSQVARPGLENKGHRMIKTLGLAAGDADCYSTFQPLFDAVIALRFGGSPAQVRQPLCQDPSKVSSTSIDPSGRRVVSVQLRAHRNLAGLRFPSACSLEERREAERLLTSALMSLPADLQGAYHPLAGSSSFAPRPGGMGAHEQAALSAQGALFAEPDSAISISAGVARDWPDARGVFASSSGNFWAWVNEEDHLRLFSHQEGQDLRGAFARLCSVEAAIEKALQERGHAFAQSDRLGYLTTFLSNIGTGLAVTVVIRLPLVSAQPDFRATCRRLRLQAATHSGAEGVWALSSLDRVGSSEVDQVNAVAASCRELIAMEADLESQAFPPNSQAATPRAKAATELGDTWKAAAAPGTPDLSGHFSLLAEALAADPAMYGRLTGQVTTMGVTLDEVIRPGLENRGHRIIKTTGIVAGDAHCYSVFRPLFDAVIAMRHGSIPPTPQRAALSTAGLDDKPFDIAGGYVVSVQVRVSRNLAGLRFPSACSFEERREAERVVSRALLELAGDASEGAYLPLPGSHSYAPRPGGMDEEEEASLEGRLFYEPDSAVAISSGFARDWPDARGIFSGASGKLWAWLNEEDHLRLFAAEDGSNLCAAFDRLCNAHAALEQALLRQGHLFARDPRLGYLAPGIASIGTGLCATVFLRLPLSSASAEFRKTCRTLKLQAQHTGGDLWALSNTERLGSSEVEQVNTVIAGVRELIMVELRIATEEGRRLA